MTKEKSFEEQLELPFYHSEENLRKHLNKPLVQETHSAMVISLTPLRKARAAESLIKHLERSGRRLAF